MCSTVCKFCKKKNCHFRQKDYSRFRGLSKDVDKTFYPGYWDKDKVIATLTIAEVMTFGLEMYLEEVELLRLAIMSEYFV